MEWQSNPYVLPLVIAGLIGFFNLLVITQRRRVAGSSPLIGALFAVSIWSFGYALELASKNQADQVLWAKVEYFGIVSLPVFILIFSLEFTQKRLNIPRKLFWLLWIVPIICLALAWTNEYHALIWNKISQKDGGGFLLLSLGHGIGFWGWISYSYLALITSTVILIRGVISSNSEFRRQAIVILIGLLVAWAGNAMYLFGIGPVPDLDTTPITFILSMVICTIGLFRFGLLDIMPIASETILDNLEDIVVVLDNSNKVLFINKAIEYFTHTEAKHMVGKYADVAFSQWPGLKELHEIQDTARSEVVLNPDGPHPFHFDTHISNVYWKKNKYGKIYMLSDISDRKTAEKNLMSTELDAGNFTSGDFIPLIFVYRMLDDKLIEINRTFITELGYDRREAVGKSLLELGVWDPYERADFHRGLTREKSLENYSMKMTGVNGTKRSFMVAARWLEIDNAAYVMVMAKPVRE